MVNYILRGALPVRAQFRHAHAENLANKLTERKRHFMAAWTELKPVSKVMPVTSSDGDYFGHTECETIEPQGPTELRTGVPTASCRRGD